MFVSLVSCNMNSNKSEETNNVTVNASDAIYNINQEQSDLMAIIYNFEELSIGKILNKLMKIVDLTRNLFQSTKGRKDIVHVIPSNT